MSKEKLSIPEIVDLMVGDKKTTKKAAEEFIKTLFSTIEDALLSGESVKVKGLGTFKLQWNEARRSIDVNTGNEIIIPGFYRTVFAPENELRELINQPLAHLEAVPLPDEDTDEGNVAEMDDKMNQGLSFFNMQASEIKEILSDIYAMSSKKGSPKESEVLEDDVDFEVDDEEKDIFIEEKPVENEESKIAEKDTEKDEESKSKGVFEDDNGFDIIREVAVLYPVVDKPMSEIHSEAEEIKIDVDEHIGVEKTEEAEKITDEAVSETLAVVEEVEPDVNVVEKRIQTETVEVRSEEESGGIEAGESIIEDTGAEKPERERIDTVYEILGSQKLEDGIEAEKTSDNTPEEAEDSDEVEAEKKARKIPVWPIVLLAFLVVGAFAGWISTPYITKLIKEKKIQQRQEFLADSLAKEMQVKQIRDSIASFLLSDSSKTELSADSAALEADSNFTANHISVSDPVSAPKDKDIDIYSVPRKYTEILAVEKIAPGSQLARFARRYYNHPNFWVYIYEANKDKIPDPDNVPVGIEVKIPKMDSRLVDPSNKQSLEYALKLQSKYLNTSSR